MRPNVFPTTTTDAGAAEVESVEAPLGADQLRVRVSRVDRSDTSYNITDGVRRISFADAASGPQRVELPLWPTAIRLPPGERIRVLLASGAHPRIARNLGSGGLLAQATAQDMQSANVSIHRGREHASYIELPLRSLPHASLQEPL